ncbi:MAG: prolyl oligopeptidase family serine peptidase [Chloroflexi bacterium]|nr:prolyl oligopeptidase family serine peptidase [Chloroflexota bacterium]
MTPEKYLDELLTLPWISPWLRPKVSRDGKWVAWTWFGMAPVGDVYVAATDGSTEPVRLSDGAERTLLVSWTPDGRSLIVAQDKGGDERFQLLRIDVERPLQMTPLTEADPAYFLRGGDLHANGRWLMYGANYDFIDGKQIEATWVYRHDLESGERKLLARPEKGSYLRPKLSPDGRFVLYTRGDRHPAGQQVWLVDVDGREDREILNFGAAVKTSAFWFPDGQRLLVMSETETHKRVGVWTLADESLQWIIDDPQRSIEEVYAPHGSDKLVIIDVLEAKLRSSLFDLESRSETELTVPTGSLIPIAPAADGKWVGLIYSSRQPDDIVNFTVEDSGLAGMRSISFVWEQTSLRVGDLTQAEVYCWRSVDGLEIQGWLYRPQGKAQGMVVYVHGGPTSHSMDRINAQLQFFARAGFVVLDPNYRGSTGFGLSFREAIKEEGWGGLEQADIRSGIEALIEEGIAQAGKVGITGTSYGGYSSWCAITRYPVDVAAAAVPICGMTDLVVDYETTRPDLRPYSEEMMGGSPEEIPEKYHERSPINFVTNIKGRLLIVQGNRDPNVTPDNVHVVKKALEDANVSYEILTFDDEGHGISKVNNKKTLYQAMLEFFDRTFSSEGT